MPGPGDYLFLITPEPIVQSRRLTRLQKSVWAAVYSWERMGRTKLSVTKLAELTGTSRQKAREAVDALVALELMDRRDFRRDGMHLVDFATCWPAWIQAEGAGSLTRRVRLEEVAAEGGGPKGSRGVDPPGPGGRTERVHPIRDPEEGRKEDLVADDPSSAPPSAPEEGEEDVEPNLDGGSLAAEERIEADREARRARRGERKKTRAPSPGALAETPSARWEFQRWRSRPAKAWSGMDLVGYWVCRHAELRRREDEEFFVSAVDAPFVLRCARNGATFVRKHLEGDWTRARDVVEAVLERAEERGMPVSFAYYFTPSKSGAVDAILSKTGRRPREKTLREKNDARGGDKDYWGEKMAAQAGEGE